MASLNLGKVVGDDGRGISSITKTGTSGLVDTYTITYTDNTTSTFTVTNGSNGSGNATWGSITGTLSNQTDLNTALSGKQATLVSGTNIKTINNQSLLGDGNITINGGSGTSDYSDLTNKPSINSVSLSGNKTSNDLGIQDTLVSGTNVKTINNQSILGSGNITIDSSDLTIVDKDQNNNQIEGTFSIENDELELTATRTNQTYTEVYNQENSYSPLVIGNGSPALSSDYSATRGYTLKCYGTVSTQLKQETTFTNPAGHKYFTSVDIYCTRYSKGYVGLCFSNNTTGYVGINATNSAWTRYDDIVTTATNTGSGSGGNSTLYIGSWSSANLDAYLDNIMVVDLTDLFGSGYEPTKSQMETAFTTFLAILDGSDTTHTLSDTALTVNSQTYSYKDIFIQANSLGVCTFDTVSEEVSGADQILTFTLGVAPETEYTDAQCKQAFVDYMNAKAVDIGMTGSNFINASGYWIQNGNSYSYNTSTAKDMLHLLIHASGCNELAKMWYKDAKTLKVRNKVNASKDNRDVAVETTVTDSTLEGSYYIFGGKTGSLSTGLQTPTYNVMLTTSAPDGNQFGAVVIQSSTTSNRWVDMKALLDTATAVYNNPSYDTSSTSLTCSYACACLMPQHNTLCYDQYDFPLLYSKNATTTCYPASMSKVLTCVCMLDFVQDLNEYMTIKTADIMGGSGPTFYDGDMITYKEALYGMMLPSSNTVAEAVARNVGKKILHSKEV